MYPAMDTTADCVPQDAFELLAQQQQRPQQQLVFPGTPQASFELAGPFPTQLDDICPKNEQDIDKEIGNLLAIKQQLRQRQQAQQLASQQQGVPVTRFVTGCAYWHSSWCIRFKKFTHLCCTLLQHLISMP
jgi:hypothetical protein